MVWVKIIIGFFFALELCNCIGQGQGQVNIHSARKFYEVKPTYAPAPTHTPETKKEASKNLKAMLNKVQGDNKQGQEDTKNENRIELSINDAPDSPFKDFNLDLLESCDYTHDYDYKTDEYNFKNRLTKMNQLNKTQADNIIFKVPSTNTQTPTAELTYSKFLGIIHIFCRFKHIQEICGVGKPDSSEFIKQTDYYRNLIGPGANSTLGQNIIIKTTTKNNDPYLQDINPSDYISKLISHVYDIPSGATNQLSFKITKAKFIPLINATGASQDTSTYLKSDSVGNLLSKIAISRKINTIDDQAKNTYKECLVEEEIKFFYLTEHNSHEIESIKSISSSCVENTTIQTETKKLQINKKNKTRAY